MRNMGCYTALWRGPILQSPRHADQLPHRFPKEGYGPLRHGQSPHQCTQVRVIRSDVREQFTRRGVPCIIAERRCSGRCWPGPNQRFGGSKKGHHGYFDRNGSFNGHVTSNCADGGNWRLKHAVRVAHQRTDTAAGRSILAAIKDSVFTVRGAKVREGVANMTGLFSFGRVMG